MKFTLYIWIYDSKLSTQNVLPTQKFEKLQDPFHIKICLCDKGAFLVSSSLSQRTRFVIQECWPKQNEFLLRQKLELQIFYLF